MACPHVAGTAALVIASDPTLTKVDVRTRLQTTADDLGPIGWDTVYGYGIVDADEATPLTGPPNQPPVADANGPYTGTEDVAITFNGSGSYDPDGDSLTYAWIFGDGNTGTGVNPTHVYTAGGTYTVTLVVNDGKVDSEPSYSTATIAEVNDPPIADAGPDQTATVNEVITFDGSGSTDPEGNIASYAWDFGDGTSGTGITVTHAYSTAGTYTVTLTVTDDGGLTDSDTAIVTVTEAPAVPTIHVASIEMSTGSRTAGRNTFVWALAKVTIVDAKGVPVEGATVYGHWEVATTDSDSGITDANGQVLLTSDSVKNPPSRTTFVFVVDNVVLSGWTYNPAANVETSDSITT
jgi:PKD repeat protein